MEGEGRKEGRKGGREEGRKEGVSVTQGCDCLCGRKYYHLRLPHGPGVFVEQQKPQGRETLEIYCMLNMLKGNMVRGRGGI